MTRGMKGFMTVRKQSKNKNPIEVNKTKLFGTLIGLVIGAAIAIFLVVRFG